MTARSFPAAFGLVAEADPEAIAVICRDDGDGDGDGGETTLTRGELERAATRMARAYAELGVTEGDMIRTLDQYADENKFFDYKIVSTLGLTADDVADTISFMATRPAHVNLDRITIRPRAQAAQYKVFRG